MKERYRLLFVCFLLVFNKTNAQTFKNQSLLNESFAYKVHTLDMFFDRFNYTKKMAVLNYIQNQKPDIQLTRDVLIRSLFNFEIFKEPKDISTSFLFVKSCIYSIHPLYLSYFDDNWYAKLYCKVLYKKKISTIELTLKVERTQQNAFKWSIIAAEGGILKSSFVNDSIAVINDSLFIKNHRGTKFFSPVSHALQFSELFKFFENRNSALDYVTTKPIPFELKKLLILINNKQIKFINLDKINYHLLQLPEWALEIKYYNRTSKNSGWLISRLQTATSESKKKYKHQILNMLNL